jgi:hypothetical protein
MKKNYLLQYYYYGYCNLLIIDYFCIIINVLINIILQINNILMLSYGIDY